MEKEDRVAISSLGGDILKGMSIANRNMVWKEVHGGELTTKAGKVPEHDPNAVPAEPFDIYDEKTVYGAEIWKQEIQEQNNAYDILTRAPAAPPPPAGNPPIFAGGKPKFEPVTKFKSLAEIQKSYPEEATRRPVVSPPNTLLGKLRAGIQQGIQTKLTETRLLGIPTAGRAKFTLVPSDLTAEILARAGGRTLIDKIKNTYEAQKAELPFTVNYAKMDTPVPVIVSTNPAPETRAAANSQVIPGKMGNLMRMLHIDADRIEISPGTSDMTKPHLKYHGVEKNIEVGDNLTFAHEATHAYQQGEKARHEKLQGSYIGDHGEELKQAIASFCNGVRSQTGRPLTDPKEISQVFDEMEKDPKILDHFPAEHMRLFRSFLNMKEGNPQEAEKVRNATCAYGPCLAHTDNKLPITEIPMLQPPPKKEKAHEGMAIA